MDREVNTSVTLGDIRVKNPVMNACGTMGYGEEFAELVNLKELGAIIPKTITLNPRVGVFQHRFIEIAGCADLRTQGLPNVGVDRFIKTKLPYLLQIGIPVIVNTWALTIDEHVRLIETLNKEKGIAGFEVASTCPNIVEERARASSWDPEETFRLIRAIKDVTDLSIISKSPTNVSITSFAKAAEDGGADAFHVQAGLLGLAIDINTRRSKLGDNFIVALGGPWLMPSTVRMVWQAAQVVKIPILASGGITCAEDALQCLIAGATAVQIGTHNFIEPEATTKTIAGIKDFLIDNEIDSIHDIIGSLMVS